ncbi:hypothetical protein NA57DRAFT_55194 [Rhizodiscina lignyota]|uniref:F-box domain-containing protein n=1 Tax=Rhizodiscina lignyota TaxID=1504668 RepID=A0A9P4IGG0_9PEZI|nr:hypothetical protein NA57DRAFT_55194 [Rhizodiscina lignyota]
MASRSGLGDLPQDVFVNCILRQITKPDLASLRATSTGFRALVTPVLFASYVNLRMQQTLTGLSYHSSEPSLPVHISPDTAKPSKSANSPPRDTQSNARGSLREQDFNLFVQAATETGVIRPDGQPIHQDLAGQFFLDGLAANYEDAQVILLLACLPHLEKLTFHGFPARKFKCLQWEMYLGRIRHGFCKLIEFKAGQYATGSEIFQWDMDDFSFLFELPYLRMLHVEFVNINNYIQRWNFAPASLPLTSLREALSLHKDSLRSLSLDFRDSHLGNGLDSDSLGSLKEFWKLTWLHMDYPRLISRKLESEEHDLSAILPDAIEVLSLNYAFTTVWGYEVRRDLIHLLRHGREICPNLKTVILPDFMNNDAEAEWDKLESMFTAQGLELSVIYDLRYAPLEERQTEIMQRWTWYMVLKRFDRNPGYPVPGILLVRSRHGML